MTRRLTVNALLAVAAMAVMAVHSACAGRLDVAGGLGWDGQGYARMLTDIWSGTANMQLRPAIPLMNRPAFWLTGREVSAFALMNFVYLGVVIFVLAQIADRYAPRLLAKIYLFITLSLTVAVSQMFAYYPALLDLGVYAVIALALYAILSRWWLAAALLTTLCVFSREFAIALIAFGIVHDVRVRTRWWKPLVAYLPPVFIALTWRQAITGTPGDEILSVTVLAGNLRFWLDPVFVALFVYYLVTMFGGVSAIVAAVPWNAFRLFREEPEWLAYLGVVIAIAAVGDADIWRYLAYALPAFVVLFVRCTREWTASRQAVIFAAGAVVTWVTQTPFDRMDSERYFIDWFPYYMRKEMVSSPELVWPIWSWRLLFAVGAVWLLSAMAAAAQRRREAAA